MKKRMVSALSSLLCCCLLFSVLSLNVSAADDDSAAEVLDVREFTATVINGVEGEEGTEEVPFTYVDSKYGSDGCWMRKYTCTSDDIVKCLFVTDFLSLNSSHEYNLSFVYASDYNKTSALQVELLYFSSSGELIKSQIIDQVFGFQSGNNVYDADFKPDVSDIKTSYNIKLRISITTPNSAGVSWRISHDIKLTDKDDDSGWFQKILNKINDVWESIKALPERIGSYIEGLKDSLSEGFDSLKDNILEGLKSLFIPSDDFLDEWAGEFQNILSEHFGFIYDLVELTISIVDDLKALLRDDYSFVIPAAEFDLNGKHYVLWDKYEVPVAHYIETVPALKYSYNTYKIVVAAICSVALYNYARKVYDEIFSG